MRYLSFGKVMPVLIVAALAISFKCFTSKKISSAPGDFACLCIDAHDLAFLDKERDAHL
jgi:hypothetical protein